jgi:hypothetical protein
MKTPFARMGFFVIFDKLKSKCMIKKLFSSLLIAGTLISNAQQVQNPGLETWTSNNVPANWGSYGQMIAALSGTNPNTEIQTTSMHSGSFAALLQNQFVAIAGSNIPGGINTGTVVLSGGKPSYGFQAYSSSPTAYDFWYKFNAISGDTAGTDITITHWNTSTNKRDTLATGASYIIGVASVYTHMTVPINWIVFGVTPDSIQLQFTSSLAGNHGSLQPPVGGQLYLDDINLSGNASGVQKLMADGSFATYPNPAANILTIKSTTDKAKHAFVYDASGRLVSAYTLNDKSATIDLSQYENGLYVYVITDEHNTMLYSSKFNVVK